MNIVELSEKNFSEAVTLFRLANKDFYTARELEINDVDVRKILFGGSENSFTYLLSDKGMYQGLVTVNKPDAEIKNLWLNYSIIDQPCILKLLEFSIKQFSAITLVYIWLNSTDLDTQGVVEDYGFEYTGEQDYIDKEKNILRYKYVFKRKK
ncbi:MAG: hypothetical protein IKC33_03960 [Clostridia bacterium]|nr:hypothetical protein [Clostridia bacterium]MBQ4587366.1 hypothetical protein [Clostridia bacterium]MBQ6883191.1 hypothetical protein [Clostridia bacterium]MBR2933448.1 hypothetical protein [Clostridia bacterium]MBR6688188.1 hypothetical protein [Clostridia bacterium]